MNYLVELSDGAIHTVKDVEQIESHDAFVKFFDDQLYVMAAFKVRDVKSIVRLVKK